MLVNLPAGAEPEDHPSPGEPVDGGGALREQRRVVDRCRRDKGADPDALGDSGQGGQESPALVRVAARGRRVAGVWHVVVSQPDAVPATVLRRTHLLKKVEGSTVVLGPEREFHGITLEGHRMGKPRPATTGKPGPPCEVPGPLDRGPRPSGFPPP